MEQPLFIFIIVLGVMCLLPLLTKIVFRQWFEEKHKFLMRLSEMPDANSKYSVH